MLASVFESGLRQGLLLIPLALGVHISFRLLRYPDLTPDGSIILGGSISTVLILQGLPPALALIISSVAAGLLGVLTAILSEVLQLDRILAGIASSLIAYSAVLRLLGRGNVALPLSRPTIYGPHLNDLITSSFCSGLLLALVIIVARSKVGLKLRTAGDNEDLVKQLGGNIKMRISGGLFWANACVGLSGGLLAQHQRFSDVGQGAGTLFVGLACILIGGAIPIQDHLLLSISSSAAGAVVYSLLIAATLRAGLHPSDLRALTAGLVLTTTLITQRIFKSERIPLFE